MTARRRVRRAAWAAVALTIPAFATSCSDPEGSMSESERQEVLRTTAAQLEALLSYDATTLSSDLAEVREIADGRFARDFSRLLSGRAGQAIRSLGAVSSVETLDLGTLDDHLVDDPDGARLLAFVRQTTTTAGRTVPQVVLSAIELTITHDGDGWRIHSLEMVTPSPDQKEQASAVQ